nr:MAG TPA: hypothetical protein [Caudoviricetes sp.]
MLSKGVTFRYRVNFSGGERCLHTDAPTRHILHHDTIIAEHRHPPAGKSN